MLLFLQGRCAGAWAVRAWAMTVAAGGAATGGMPGAPPTQVTGTPNSGSAHAAHHDTYHMMLVTLPS